MTHLSMKVGRIFLLLMLVFTTAIGSAHAETGMEPLTTDQTLTVLESPISESEPQVIVDDPIYLGQTHRPEGSMVPLVVQSEDPNIEFETTLVPFNQINVGGWFNGVTEYSIILNCPSMIGGYPYTEFGVGTYTGFYADPDAGTPEVNDIYYVHVVIAGLGYSCSNTLAYIDLLLPPNTTLAISQQTPVYCYYEGQSQASVCPQTLPPSDSNSGAYWIPAGQDTDGLWPIPRGKFWEFQIPVRSSAPITNANMQANLYVIDGNDSPWLRPKAPVTVFAAQDPTVFYPALSTEVIENADGSFEYKSHVNLHTRNLGGTLYFELGTSSGDYSARTETLAVPANSGSVTAWSNWEDSTFSLQASTNYFWRARFETSGGQSYPGIEQTFKTNSTGMVTIGDGTAASCTNAAFWQTLNDPDTKEIYFNCGANNIMLTMNAQFSLQTDLKINGGNKVTLKAASSSRHFAVPTGKTLELRQIILKDGNISNGCGGSISIDGNLYLHETTLMNNHSTTNGGALCTSGTGEASVDRSWFHDNTAGSTGGAIYNRGRTEIFSSEIYENTAEAGGGGIYNSGADYVGALFLANSLVSNNQTVTSWAGGIYNSAVLTVINSTIAGNIGEFVGGIASFQEISLESVTIADNFSTYYFTAGLHIPSDGWSANVKNTIVANNTPKNCHIDGSYNHSQGFNLDTGSSCDFDQSTDFSHQNPMLGQLQYNGGRTRSMRLGPRSIAIDNGMTGWCGYYDQRGFYGGFDADSMTTRRADGNGDGVARCDIGAFEYIPDRDPLIAESFLPFIHR